jgi:hypothetical protein
MAAQLAWLLPGVKISPMGIWNVVQRLGESVARYNEGLSQYHADSRSEGASTQEAPPAVVVSVDGSMPGMQVRQQAGGARGASRFRPCRRCRKATSMRSKRVYGCYPPSAWKPRPGAIR